MRHRLLGGDQDHQLPLDVETFFVDLPVFVNDLLCAFNITLLQCFHRGNNGVFHHRAKQEYFIFYLLYFVFKCFSDHNFLFVYVIAKGRFSRRINLLVSMAHRTPKKTSGRCGVRYALALTGSALQYIIS